MNNAVKVKQKVWKQWKSGGSKEAYMKAKRPAKAAAYFVNKGALTEWFVSINNNSDKNQIFKIAKSLKRDDVDVVGE